VAWDRVKHVAFLELWLRMTSLELWLGMASVAGVSVRVVARTAGPDRLSSLV